MLTKAYCSAANGLVTCRWGLIGTVILVLLLGGCATAPTGGQVTSDPYENFNRKMFSFNSSLDDYLMEPVASGYSAVTPDPVQTGVSNFFQNLTNINVILNDFLQGKIRQGFEDTGRFAINTTVGIVGLFDVAKKIGLEQNQEDFGQTLAVWGVGQGPFLVLPFLGPTTVRDTPGYAVSALTNPLVSVYPLLLGLDVVDTRVRADGAIKFVKEAALDPYIFTREAFLQWRNFQIYDGNPPIFEEFEEFEEFDEAFLEEGALDGEAFELDYETGFNPIDIGIEIQDSEVKVPLAHQEGDIQDRQVNLIKENLHVVNDNFK